MVVWRRYSCAPVLDCMDVFASRILRRKLMVLVEGIGFSRLAIQSFCESSVGRRVNSFAEDFLLLIGSRSNKAMSNTTEKPSRPLVAYLAGLQLFFLLLLMCSLVCLEYNMVKINTNARNISSDSRMSFTLPDSFYRCCGEDSPTISNPLCPCVRRTYIILLFPVEKHQQCRQKQEIRQQSEDERDRHHQAERPADLEPR